MGEKKHKKKGKKHTVVTFADDQQRADQDSEGLEDVVQGSTIDFTKFQQPAQVTMKGTHVRNGESYMRDEGPIRGMPYLANPEKESTGIRIGTQLPPIIVYENCAPPIPVNVRDLFSGARLGILFGVPGAFTPVCSTNHLPGFLKDYDKFKHRGVEVIACVTVNDPYVSTAWGYYQNATNKVKILSDVLCEFTRSIGMETNMYAQLGSIRSKRYAMILENGVVKYLTVEDNAQKTSCTMAGHVLEALDNRYHDGSKDNPLTAWYYHGKGVNLPPFK